MHPMRRAMQHASHDRVHKKDIDTISLCKRYKLSMIYDLYFVHSVFVISSTNYPLEGDFISKKAFRNLLVGLVVSMSDY